MIYLHTNAQEESSEISSCQEIKKQQVEMSVSPSDADGKTGKGCFPFCANEAN